MSYKKFVFYSIEFFILCSLTFSWTLPPVSHQPNLPDDYEESINKLKEIKEEKNEIKKKSKESLREHHKCSYIAHQKNRLAYFATMIVLSGLITWITNILSS